MSTEFFIPKESALDAISKLNWLRTNDKIELCVNSLTAGFLICRMLRIPALPVAEIRMSWRPVSQKARRQNKDWRPQCVDGV